MLKFLRTVLAALAIIVIILSGYALITGNITIMPYMVLFMGAMLFVMGMAEIKDERLKMGVASIIVSFFVLSVFAQTF